MSDRQHASPYQAGGSLPADAPTYVTRRADEEFYQRLRAGDYCVVLNSRQMGKSSLRIRTANRLQTQDGVACASIDFSVAGSKSSTQEQWYYGRIRDLAKGFDILAKFDLSQWWNDHGLMSPDHRFAEFIETVLLRMVDRPLVVFVDEVDYVLGLDFIGDFFSLIRSCYNVRAEKPEYKRLTFALLGVADPSDFISDKSRTPYNIGFSIPLAGFTLSESMPLAAGLEQHAARPDEVLRAILKWTGGQPFLTHKICKLFADSQDNVATGDEESSVAAVVRSRVIENWVTQDIPRHLRTISDRIMLSPNARTVQLLGMYQEILEQGSINADNSSEQIEFRLTGLVVEQERKLKVYNPIYAAVFDQRWVEHAFSTLRPYAESMKAWLASQCSDESRLLRGDALVEARTWAARRSLSKEDYEFISASQDADAARNAVEFQQKIDAEKEANSILREAEQKAVNLAQQATESEQQARHAEQQARDALEEAQDAEKAALASKKRAVKNRNRGFIILGLVLFLSAIVMGVTVDRYRKSDAARQLAVSQSYQAMTMAQQATEKAQVAQQEERRARDEAEKQTVLAATQRERAEQSEKEARVRLQEAQHQLLAVQQEREAVLRQLSDLGAQFKSETSMRTEAEKNLQLSEENLRKSTEESTRKIVEEKTKRLADLQDLSKRPFAEITSIISLRAANLQEELGDLGGGEAVARYRAAIGSGVLDSDSVARINNKLEAIERLVAEQNQLNTRPTGDGLKMRILEPDKNLRDVVNVYVPTELKDGKYVPLDSNKAKLVRPAAEALEKAFQEIIDAGGTPLVSSMFRSADYQKQLREAYEKGLGNIAGLPGTTPHETGLAVDVNSERAGVPYERFVAIMKKFGWVQAVRNEPWHFEYRRNAKGEIDLSGWNTRALIEQIGNTPKQP